MFLSASESEARIRERLAVLADRPFSYLGVGATRDGLAAAPKGFVLDAYGTSLGHGEAVFDRARAAIASFGNYPSDFTRVVSLGESLTVGLVFGTLARHAGFASLHPCRVIYVLRDEVASRGGRPGQRFGFGLGTLPGHVLQGEERFLVRLDEATGEVTYEVLAFSRPATRLARLGRPLLRVFQGRFRRETIAAMRERCGVGAGDRPSSR